MFTKLKYLVDTLVSAGGILLIFITSIKSILCKFEKSTNSNPNSHPLCIQRSYSN